MRGDGKKLAIGCEVGTGREGFSMTYRSRYLLRES